MRKHFATNYKLLATSCPIGVSSNGRTSGFGPEYRGSSPCTPATHFKKYALAFFDFVLLGYSKQTALLACGLEWGSRN